MKPPHRTAAAMLLAAAWSLFAPASAAAQVSELQATYRPGQVFLTWRELAGADVRYRIYRAGAPIDDGGDLASAELLGEVDDRTSLNRRDTELAGADEYFAIEDLGPPLASDQGLFVHTVTSSAFAWYAVTSVVADVEDAAIAVGQNALAEPVAEAPDRPLPVLQSVKQSKRDYVRWVSAHDAPLAPAMWYAPSQPFNLRIAYDPDVDPAPRPVLLKLHFRGGNYQHEPEPTHPEAILVSPDDWFEPFPHNTYWYGLNPAFPDTASYALHENQDYTVRRVLADLDFAQAAFPSDPERVYAYGVSMGAVGAVFLAYMFPERIAAVNALQTKFDFGCGSPGCWFEVSTGNLLWGTSAQNLPCNEGMGTYDRLDLAHLAALKADEDLPMFTSLDGRFDELFGWADKPPIYAALQAARQPATFFWDDGTHLGETSTALGYWAPTWWERFEEMFRYEIHQAVPAFTDFSLDLDAGDGNPFLGDMIGYVNGSVGWDTDTIEDQADHHALAAFLRTGPVPDAANSPDATVDWTPRRLQQLAIAPGQQLRFKNFQGAAQQLVDDRIVTTASSGIATVDDAGITTEGNLLRLESIAFPAAGGDPEHPIHLVATGVVSPGGWLSLNAFGAPGQSVFLAWGTIPASIELGGLDGLLQIGNPFLMGMGFIGLDGKRVFTVPLNDGAAAAVGVTFLYQALVGTTFTSVATASVTL